MTGIRLLLLLLLTTVSLRAQQLSLFTQYRENMVTINPAAVEADFLAFGQNLTFGGSYRTQWVGIEGSPTTQVLRGSYLAADMSGVALQFGGHLINDVTGPTGFTGLYGRFSGILTDDPEYGGLAVGISAGFVQYRVKTTDLVFYEGADNAGAMDRNQWFPDVGVGIFFYQSVGGRFSEGDYIYGGISVPQVAGLDLTFAADTEDGTEFAMQRVRHFYGNLGFYKFFGNDSFLEPSVWVKAVPNAPINVDVNLRYQLPAALWVGAGGSSAGTVHLETGFNLGEGGYSNLFKIGYGFDYSFSSFGPSTGATHELNLTYSIFR